MTIPAWNPTPIPEPGGNRQPPGPPIGRKPKRLPKVLTIEECESLVKAARATRNKLRDEALVLTLWGAGMRVSEAVGASVADLRYDPVYEVGILTVIGKGDEQREVILPNPAWRALVAYLHDRIPAWHFGHRDLELDREPLFESERQNRMSRKTVWKLLKNLAEPAGIDPKRVRPHILRHSCASHMRDAGWDLRSIQSYMGHADIGSTTIYTHLNNEHLRSMGSQHPMAGW